MRDTTHPRPLIGLAAGLVAGVAASVVMAAFQAKAKPLIEAEETGDPATVKAADKASEIVSGEPVPEPWRDTAGQVVHYVTGATLGALYGLMAEYRPEATKGFGSAFGTMTSLLLDEAAVPAAGLSGSPKETPPAVHAYGLGAHLVYGVALEGVRTLIAGRRG
jgi:putative membrane protein